MRMKGDFIKQTHFPRSTLEQLRHKFSGSDHFSTLDLNHTFHQMEIDEQSSRLFVFTTLYGLYCFKRLVQGIYLASTESNEAQKRF